MEGVVRGALVNTRALAIRMIVGEKNMSSLHRGSLGRNAGRRVLGVVFSFEVEGGKVFLGERDWCYGFRLG